MNAQHIPDLTIEAYHSRPEWSHSQIEVLYQSPPLFHGRFITREFERESSPTLDDGTIVHECLTSGRMIEDVVAIIPPDVLNEKGERRGGTWKEWSEANSDKIQRKRAECDALFRMVESVRRHPRASWLLDAPGHFEHSIVWTDEETGLQLRARPDKLALLNPAIIVDVKTTRAETYSQFQKHLAEYGYHRQLAWYEDGVKALGIDVEASALITVDKTPAHECHVYEVTRSAIELGRMENRDLLTELKYRIDANNWESRDAGAIIEIDVPMWAYAATANRS